MRIKCGEYYDKVVEYAESIGDKTLQECLEKLKSWENHPRLKHEMEIYQAHDPYSFIFKERYENGSYGIIGEIVYHGPTIGWKTHT